jgi:hypothetical protein
MSDLTIPIGPIDIDDPDAVASDFEAARAILDYEPEGESGDKDAPKFETKTVRRGDKKGHPFRGNRYTGGIKRDNGEGAM